MPIAGRLFALFSSGALCGTGTALLFNSLVAAEEKVDPPKYPWSHSGLADSYDHARYKDSSWMRS